MNVFFALIVAAYPVIEGSISTSRGFITSCLLRDDLLFYSLGEKVCVDIAVGSILMALFGKPDISFAVTLFSSVNKGCTFLVF